MAPERELDDQTRRAKPLQVAKAVFWSFLGVRKSKHHQSDLATITPLQVIIAGLIGAVLFVFCLIMVVRAVTS